MSVSLIQKIDSFLTQNGKMLPSSEEDKISSLFLLVRNSEDRLVVQEGQRLLQNIVSENLSEPLKNQAKTIIKLQQERLPSLDTLSLTEREVHRVGRNNFLERASVRPLTDLAPCSVSLSKIMDALRIPSNSLDGFLYGFFWTPQELFFRNAREVAIPILDEIVACMKQGRAPDFSFLQYSPVKVAVLFKIVDSLSMDEFHMRYLEPFHKKFPGIPLASAPRSIRQFEVSESDADVKDVDFSRFSKLEKINFPKFIKLTAAQINSLSATLIELGLTGVYESHDPWGGFNFDWKDVDFSRLSRLEKIDLSRTNVGSKINSLTSTLKELKLRGVYIRADVNFSRLSRLEKIDLSETSNLTPAHINSLPSTLKELSLSKVDVAGFDFSRFSRLEKIDFFDVLDRTRNLIPAQVTSLSGTLKELMLSNGFDAASVDFRRFSRLEKTNLSSLRNLTSAQINLLPSSLKELSLPDVDVADINFNRFSRLEALELARNLTPVQVSSIPSTLKEVSLWGVADVTAFDCSRFPGLEKLNLSNLTSAQVSSIPSTLKKLALYGVDVAGFDFRKFSRLEDIYVYEVSNLTPAQVSSLPSALQNRVNTLLGIQGLVSAFAANPREFGANLMASLD